MNPFVDDCDLTNILRDVCKDGRKVKLITRPPHLDKDYERRKEREEYHRILKKEGVFLKYNKNVHAKLIVVDQALAIVSSMNFYSASSGGKSWEAGLVSLEDEVVDSVVKSILDLFERPESKEM